MIKNSPANAGDGDSGIKLDTKINIWHEKQTSKFRKLANLTNITKSTPPPPRTIKTLKSVA